MESRRSRGAAGAGRGEHFQRRSARRRGGPRAFRSGRRGTGKVASNCEAMFRARLPQASFRTLRTDPSSFLFRWKSYGSFGWQKVRMAPSSAEKDELQSKPRHQRRAQKVDEARSKQATFAHELDLLVPSEGAKPTATYYKRQEHEEDEWIARKRQKHTKGKEAAPVS